MGTANAPTQGRGVLWYKSLWPGVWLEGLMFNAVPADFNWVAALALSLFKGLATAGFISLVVYCSVRIMSSIIDSLRASPLGPFFLAILARLRGKVDNVRIAAPRSRAPHAMTASPSDIKITEAIVDPSLAEKEKN